MAGARAGGRRFGRGRSAAMRDGGVKLDATKPGIVILEG
jgi:hypothetical protein